MEYVHIPSILGDDLRIFEHVLYNGYGTPENIEVD